MVPARTGQTRLTSDLGAGSSAQCFVGDFMMILEISEAVVGLSVSSGGTVCGCTVAAGALRFTSRMSSTFFRKCAANSSAVYFRVVDVAGILSRPLTFVYYTQLSPYITEPKYLHRLINIKPPSRTRSSDHLSFPSTCFHQA